MWRGPTPAGPRLFNPLAIDYGFECVASTTSIGRGVSENALMTSSDGLCVFWPPVFELQESPRRAIRDRVLGERATTHRG